jgi:hypothetical protein
VLLRWQVLRQPTVTALAFPAYVCAHVGKVYGLKAVVQQTCWDVAYNLEVCMRVGRCCVPAPLRCCRVFTPCAWYYSRQVFCEQVPELQLFSNFLRELYDTDVLLFFLHARAAAKREAALEVGP